MCAVPLRRQIDRAPSAVIPGAKAAPFPGFITPCDPTLRDRAPDGPGWLHEIKIDGYRAQVHVHHGRITIYSRSGYNWTDHFHQIAQAVKALSGHDFIIDGEATVFGNTALAVKKPGSSSNARRATLSPSWPLSRSSARARAKSPRFTWDGARGIGSSTPARRAAATPSKWHGRFANDSIL